MNAAPQLNQANYIRGSVEPLAKEWFHFIVLDDDFDLLINFSLSQGHHRLTLLIREGSKWTGEVVSLQETVFEPGTLRLRSDLAHFEFDGRYAVMGFSGDSIDLRLQFEAQSQSAFATTSTPDGRGDLNWIGTPRCTVTGFYQGAGAYREFHRAIGYQDHNWGRFSWGCDFNWHWSAFVSQERDGLAGVHSCLFDESGTTVLSEALMIWRSEKYLRTFRDQDLEVTRTYLGQQRDVFRIPGIMQLAIPGRFADLCRVEVKGMSGPESLAAVFEPISLAQIGIPGDDPGVTLLSEYSAAVTVSGRLGGRQINQRSPGVMEEARTVSPR